MADKDEHLSRYCGNCRARLPVPEVWGMCRTCKSKPPETNHNNYCERCGIPFGAGGYSDCTSRCVSCPDRHGNPPEKDDDWKPWVATDCAAWNNRNPDGAMCHKCHKPIGYGQKCHRAW